MKEFSELSKLNVSIEIPQPTVLDPLVSGEDAISKHTDPTHGGTNVGHAAGSSGCACACACWPEA